MNKLLIILMPLIVLACTDNQPTAFYIGTYTDGDSEGIYRCELDGDGHFGDVHLVAKTENPSFLDFSCDGNFLFSVNELTEGRIESYRIDENQLTLINSQPSGGAHPCFVTTNKKRELLLANYSGGNIGLYKFNELGVISSDFHTVDHKGVGSHPRQDAAHAHSAWFVENTDQAIAVDLGTNELHFYTIAQGKLVANNQPKTLLMNEGAGPRHLAFHPKMKQRFYVVNELDCTVSLVEKQLDGSISIEQSISTLPNDYQGENTCADVHISSDGRFLYASNRGHNSLAIYSIDALNGHLTQVGIESVRGDGPRNFAFACDDQFIIVANQKSNQLVSFRRDRDNGMFEFIDEIEVSSPVCVKMTDL